MLNNSKDLFYVVLAFGILWVSLGMFWVLWYVGRILREFLTIVKEIREKVQKVDALLDFVRRKMENSSYHLVLLTEGIKKLIDVYHKKASEKRKKSPKSK